jgi:hypothetical protein
MEIGKIIQSFSIILSGGKYNLTTTDRHVFIECKCEGALYTFSSKRGS